MAELDRDPTTGLLLPVPGASITQLYGPDNTDPSVQHLYIKGYHTGIDFGGVPEGTPVLSPTDGTVVLAGENAGYGECVVVDRSDGLAVLFGHLSRLTVQAGEQVTVGQEIGGIGTTGVSTGVHLHLEYRRNGTDIDPGPFLQAAVASPPAGPVIRTTAEVNFRERPSEDAAILGVVPAATLVALRRDAYFPVRWNGRAGWVWGEYLELEAGGTVPAPSEPTHAAPLDSPARRTGRTTAQANLRAGPGTEYPVLTSLPLGTPFEVVGEQGAWLQVSTGGTTGYLHRSLVAVDGEAAPVSQGRTTAYPNLRAGAGTTYAVLRVLDPGTSVAILDEQGEWLHVRVAGTEGYVHRDFVTFADQGVPDGFLRSRPDLALLPLAPAPSDQLAAAGATNTEQLVAATWNRYGGLLAALSRELRIDPAIAVAVLAIEAGGRGFGADGRMILRFENHIFYDEWGKRAPDTFAQHFSFNVDQPWQGHRWRPSAAEPWREFHGDQGAEWQVFELACGLDDTGAKRSISMGAPQIMGFNCTAIGYESVQEMFDAFSRSEQAQLIGFFDFVQGASADSPRVLALQRRDFNTFAALYNGSGQAATYASLIGNALDAFHGLRSA